VQTIRGAEPYAFGTSSNCNFQGGGRKGLPASFLNRFVKVNYQAYTEQDYVDIAAEVEPSL
jgi:midasin (ATPase involved in ribosome maturation)